MKIDEYIAQRFMKKISRKTSLNVNVINEKSIIIAASLETERIGEFHALSHTMITEHLQEGIVSLENAAANHSHPGVNFLLTSRGQAVGVIGVTGDPEKVYEIASVLRMAFETMLEYEGKRMAMENLRNLNSHFIHTLLYHEGSDSPEMLPLLAQQLHLKPDITRIPVLFCFSSLTLNISELEQIFRSSGNCSSQDIICSPKSDQILLFIQIQENQDDLLSTYRYYLASTLSPLLSYLRQNQLQHRIYVGTFENRLIDYCNAYQRIQWLIRQASNIPGHSFYLYDYLQTYFNSLIPVNDLDAIFAYMSGHTPADILDSIQQCIPVLDRNNYNLITSSQELFIHKNTLIYRLSKITAFFSLHPQKSTADRNFLSYFCLYLSRHRLLNFTD